MIRMDRNLIHGCLRFFSHAWSFRKNEVNSRDRRQKTAYKKGCSGLDRFAPGGLAGGLVPRLPLAGGEVIVGLTVVGAVIPRLLQYGGPRLDSIRQGGFPMILKATSGAKMPVARVERATEHTGPLEKAWLKVRPSSAIFSTWGIDPNLAP